MVDMVLVGFGVPVGLFHFCGEEFIFQKVKVIIMSFDTDQAGIFDTTFKVNVDSLFW